MCTVTSVSIAKFIAPPTVSFIVVRVPEIIGSVVRTVASVGVSKIVCPPIISAVVIGVSKIVCSIICAVAAVRIAKIVRSAGCLSHNHGGKGTVD